MDLSRVALREMPINSHKLSLECFVEDGWQEGVEFGLGFGLQLSQGVYFSLQVIQVGDNAALFGEGRETEREVDHDALV